MDYSNYRELLREEFEKRVKINSSYSLRAFASKIGIAPSRLSEVLNNKQGLSPRWAGIIAKKLHFSEYRSKQFQLLVETQSKSKIKASLALKQLLELKKHYIKKMPLDHYSALADWYHPTIVELLKTKDTRHSLTWISKQLGIPKDTVEEAIKRLKRLNVLNFSNGKYTVTDHNPFSIISEIPSDAIKEHHKQIIQKSTQALYDQALDEREFNTLVLSINDKDIPEIKEKIRNFVNDLNITYANNKKARNKVYCTSIQFFNLLVR